MIVLFWVWANILIKIVPEKLIYWVDTFSVAVDVRTVISVRSF